MTRAFRPTSVRRPPLRTVLAVGGAVLSPALAYGTISLVARAWSAWGDFEPPYGASLVILAFPVLTIGIWAAVGVGLSLTRNRNTWLAVPIFSVIAVLMMWETVALAVPMEPAAYYAGSTSPDDIPGSLPGQCGPGGIPTWWPSWLPI
jgi:hypothetical protein